MRPWLIAIMIVVAMATTRGSPMTGYAHGKGDGYGGPPIGYRK